MGCSYLVQFGVVVILTIIYSSGCLAAPSAVRSLNHGRGNNGNNIHRHENNGRDIGNGYGVNHVNGRGHDNGRHVGHQLHSGRSEIDTGKYQNTPEPIGIPTEQSNPNAPPHDKETHRVPSWEEWLQTWETSHAESCGYPGTAPFLKDLRIATLPNEEHSYAELGNYPWMVSLKVSHDFHWCGGVLIADQWVVTAAHCLFSIILPMWGEKSWSVHLGVLNISAHEETEQVFNVSKIMVHPLFDKHMLMTRDSPVGIPSDHDIALVKMAGRAEINPWVRPVCLPEVEQEPEVGKLCVVTGWGWSNESAAQSDVLKQGKVPIIDYDECHALDVYNQLLAPNMMCAGYEEGGVDACKFDSGGPLQCQYDEQWVLAGVVSWGDANGPGCAEPLRPGVYTRMDTHVTWIQETIYADYAGLPQITWDQIIPNPMLHPYR